MRRNAYLWAFGQKSDFNILCGYHDLLQPENNSSVGIYVRYILAIYVVHMRRNSASSASGLKTALIMVFSDHDFL